VIIRGVPVWIAASPSPPESGETLYRALREDVALRFVAVAHAEFAGAEAYEVVHEDGDVDGAGGAVLVTPFELPAGGEDELLAHWSRLRELFAPRQGYLGSRLLHGAGPARFRYVAIVRWSSPLMYARTLREPAVEEVLAAQPFPGEPALYLAEG
jgi:hypothetical protein